MKLLSSPLLVITLVLLTALSLVVILGQTGCSVITDTQQNINEMTKTEYDAFKNKISTISQLANSRISKDWDTQKIDKALDTINDIQELIKTTSVNSLDATSLVRQIMGYYGEVMGLDLPAQQDINDAALLIEIMIGSITLDIEGQLDTRGKELALTILEGLKNGLM